MARHARTPVVAVGLGRAADWIRTWATRTERTWSARLAPAKNATTLTPRVGGDLVKLLAAGAATVGVFGLLFVLIGHPARPRVLETVRSESASRTVSRSAPAPTSQVTQGSSVSTAVPSDAAAVTPPPIAVPVAAAVPVPVPSPSTSAPAGSGTAAAVGGPVQGSSTLSTAAPPPLQPPVSGQVLQGFGWAYSVIFGDWQQHTGLDLAAQAGEPVLAPGAGVVAAVRHDSLWGWVVSIVLDHGYSTNVSPLAQVDVRVGQAVQAGTRLGTAAGAAPAEADLPPHIFWQVFQDTRPIDPSVS